MSEKLRMRIHDELREVIGHDLSIEIIYQTMSSLDDDDEKILQALDSAIVEWWK